MNSSEYPVRAIFFTKNKLIGEQLFPNNITLGEIKDFYQQNLSDGKTLLFNTYYINSHKIEDSNIISRNIQPAPNAKLLDISIAIEVIDSKEKINTSINLDDRNEQIYTQIIQPKINPFGLIVFFPQYNKIQYEEYPSDYLEKKGLKYINNNKLIYCNSPNELFLSLAENSDDLWIIKNKNYAIIKKSIPFVKNNYSMIYIPNFGECGSVFFIGGDNCRTFFYDIKAHVFEKWGNMLNSHFEPALYVYGDYLYCFNSLNENNTYFQKTFLGSNTRRMWEKVYPRFKEVDPKEFYNNNFAVSKSTEGTILFVGGKNASDNTFIFNPLNNTMIKTNGENVKIDFVDKKFYSLNQLIDIAIPSNFYKNHELALLNKYNYSLTKIKYKVGQKNSNINLISTIEKFQNLFDENSQKGNISLEGKFFSLNQNNPFYVFRRTIGKPVFNQINKWLQSRNNQKYYNPNNINNNNEMQRSMNINYKNEIQKSIDINNKNETQKSMDIISNKNEIQKNMSHNSNQQISIVHNNDIQLNNQEQLELKNAPSSEIINTIYHKIQHNENEKQNENENVNEKQNEQPYEENSHQPIEPKKKKKKHKKHTPVEETNNFEFPKIFDTYNNEEQYVDKDNSKAQDSPKNKDNDEPFNKIKAEFDLKIRTDVDDLKIEHYDYDKLILKKDKKENKENEKKEDVETNKQYEIYEKYKNSNQIIENENEEKATEKNDEKEEGIIYKKDTFENYVSSHNIDNVEDNSDNEMSDNQQKVNKNNQNEEIKEEEDGLNEIKEEEKETTENVESKNIEQENSENPNNKDFNIYKGHEEQNEEHTEHKYLNENNEQQKEKNIKTNIEYGGDTHDVLENKEINNLIKDNNINNDNNNMKKNITENNPINTDKQKENENNLNINNNKSKENIINIQNNQKINEYGDKEQHNENQMNIQYQEIEHNINNDEENEQKEIEDHQEINYIQNNEVEEININNNQQLEGDENIEQIILDSEEEKMHEHQQEGVGVGEGEREGEMKYAEVQINEQEQGREEEGEYQEEDNIFPSIEEEQINNEEEQHNNEFEEAFEHEHEQFYQYSAEENESENVKYEIEDIKNKSNQNKGKSSLIKISDNNINNINTEEITKKEENKNNKKLQKYQRFVKNVEYNENGGNVVKSQKKEEIVEINNINEHN